jgi:ABC-type uncharacterized transport system ATPase subunit
MIIQFVGGTDEKNIFSSLLPYTAKAQYLLPAARVQEFIIVSKPFFCSIDSVLCQMLQIVIHDVSGVGSTVIFS